ncbi:MAG: hypothetical protein EXR61_05445 [Chloroflexi bacterium]|nr:hypothetical protein [Chloroflexota bacterium]
MLAGVVVGLGAARLAVRSAPPAPPPTATMGTSILATPSADTEALVFRQPLSAGCATAASVWVVSDGGGMGRFVDGRWFLVDTTLRSLVAVACAATEALAVGPAGRVVTADEVGRTITVDTSGLADLTSVAALPGGEALATGAQGTILQRSGGWLPFARGIDEDLLGASFAGTASAWAVGSGGVTYHLEDRGWRALPTGLALALRAVSAGPDLAVAVGDDGAVLRWCGSWTRLASGTTATLRSAALVGTTAWVVGDEGVALRLDLVTERAERIDLGTACAVRSVFVRGSDEVWFVASAETRAAVWRRDATGLRRWGAC